MIISHRHRFIFLKTMKTASTSMEIALSSVLGPDDVITPARPDLESRRTTGVGGQNYRLDHPDVPKRPLWRKLLGRPERYYHATVGYYEHMPAWRVKRYIGDDIWNSYFKFAFERNPWERQVSFYHYKTRGKDAPESFEAFLGKGKKARLPNWEIYTIDDEIAVDFVGRYENIAEDFAEAMSRIGLEDIALPRANVGKKKCAAKGYREYYDESAKSLVGRWYANEIRHFDYEF